MSNMALGLLLIVCHKKTVLWYNFSVPVTVSNLGQESGRVVNPLASGTIRFPLREGSSFFNPANILLIIKYTQVLLYKKLTQYLTYCTLCQYIVMAV
jgi:hypothetical protein